MPILKIYNEDEELILVSQEFQGYKGHGLLTDLLPNTTYEEGTYFVSWEDKDFESEKIPVPRFTTESNTNKELVFYFKDALTVEPMTAYDIAVRNGFTGTEEEWVKSIKGEPGEPGKPGKPGKKGESFRFEDFTPEQLDSLRTNIATEFNIPVFTPLNFTEKNHLLNDKIFTDGKGNFGTTINMNDYKLSGGKTYYLDTKKGDNANDGLSKDASMQSFRELIPKVSDNDTIIVAEGNYFRDHGAVIQKPFNKSVNIIGENDNVNLIIADEPTWEKTSGRTNVYEFNRSSTDRVVDVNNDTELKKVNSIDLVDTTPNSYFIDGTTVYANADNMPNTDIVPVMSSTNLQSTSLASDIYFENINFIGGKNCVELNLSSSNNAFFNNCSFNYGAEYYNGLAITGGENIVLNNCTANNNSTDGFNYHIGEDDSKPFIIEVDCTGLNNGIEKGTDGVKSNNGTSIHDGLKAIRVNGLYGRNDGGNVTDVNEGTESWNLGCTAFESYQGKDFQTSSGSNMWLDNCIAYGSENSINSADSNSIVYTRLGNYQNKLIIGEEIKY